MTAKAYLLLVLHAHLPYVRHPEHDRFLEEDWLFEALSGTYLPLLDVLEGLQRDHVPFRLTLSLSPTLLCMLEDPLLQQRYVRYLDMRLAALAGERKHLRNDADFLPVAEFYTTLYARLRERYVNHDKLDVIGAYRRLMHAGYLEIITTGATHGYLPLLSASPENIHAQVTMGLRTHLRLLGERPRGFWLPECGSTPGMEHVLAQHGLDYFFLDGHGLLNAQPRPKYGVHRPVRTPGGPAAFARDHETSRQVWSRDTGYPGDFLYREFYRDAGFDISAAHIAPLLHAATPGFTGLKYFRITGKGEWKEPYHPEWARQRAVQHAADFVQRREQQVKWLGGILDAPPVITAMYDAELFGHWWFEGALWIDALARQLADSQSGIRAVTPTEYLDSCGDLQPVEPPECSWGAGGFHEVWLNNSNDWIYPYLQSATQRMIRLVQIHPDATGSTREILDQAARELLLAQASDWAFIIHSATALDYAEKRFKQHLHRFTRLADMIEQGTPDMAYLHAISARDNLFPDMDYRIFSPVAY